MSKNSASKVVRPLGNQSRRASARRRPNSGGGASIARPSQPPPQVRSQFENKAGKYELIRIEGDQAHYSFTNHQDKTVDATMSLIMWQRMQERAEAALKETA